MSANVQLELYLPKFLNVKELHISLSLVYLAIYIIHGSATA